MLIDVDRLEALNDTHGHAAGDTALCAVAESIRWAAHTEIRGRDDYNCVEFVIIRKVAAPDSDTPDESSE
jgi:GGDEF domain-containing protein